ncbi:hypothetical protein CBL_08100 [Carabus blaptoides fortunei]
MLLFMEQHPEIGNEKLALQYDVSYRREQWMILTKLLNKLPGKPKNPGKWQKAWQDWRYNTRKKIAAQKKVKLNNLEHRLLNLSNFDFTPTLRTWHESADVVEVKSEILEPNINDILETNLTETNDESISAFQNVQISNVATLSPEAAVTNNRQTQRTRQRRKYIKHETYSAKQIHRMAKCVEKSVNSVKRICKTQASSSSKIVSLLEENSRTLQSLAESQMRQAEALERQVSLEESRNSILKLIASTLNSVKKI